ncbi:MAG: RNA 2',3'-cyclic phosphodiesterase [Thermodesulfobacteriota bacterium]
MRTFVAIELPADIKKALKTLQEELQSAGRKSDAVSWGKPGNIHLTLKFLGEVESSGIEEIGSVLEEAGKGAKPFTLTLGGAGGAGGVGAFPSLKNPRVIWVGIGECEELRRLRENIEEGLERIGFEKEGRPFHPHLTLGRVRKGKRARLPKEAGGTGEAGGAGGAGKTFTVDSFTLFRSELGPGGAKHHPIKEITLGHS